VRAFAAILVLCAFCAATSPASADGLPAGQRELARRALRSGAVVLSADATGRGYLHYVAVDDVATPLACGPLPGAWGLWLDDVDGDGRAEALVASRRPARFDPAVENRLLVLSLAEGRCVPLWRGTRLAGRFDDLAVSSSNRGELFAWERIGGGSRRVAIYRWSSFGYALERVLWQGEGAPPAPLRRHFDSLHAGSEEER